MTSEQDFEPTLPTPRSAAGEADGARSGTPGAGRLLAGRFRLRGPLGAGGMGEVFRAEDLSLGQDVALKLLPAGLARDPDALRLLREEVRVARRVSHPNVCRVHDLGEADGELFLTMELVEGESLAALLRRIGRLPGEKALEIGKQVAAGLAAAHAAGVVHRDLKPANVLLDADGRARVADFGLALAAEAAPGGGLAGTPAYMAPEQLAGGGATTRSDVYALGLVLYELFTGRRAVEATTLEELRARQAAADPLPPSRVVREVDPAVERAILRCLARDPAARPRTALEVLTELSGGDALGAALAAGQTPSPSAVAASGTSGRLAPRVAFGLLAAFLGPALGSYLLYRVAPFPFTITQVVGLPEPPAVLFAQARDALTALGMPTPRGEVETSFVYDEDVLRQARTNRGDPGRWERLRDHRPAAILFSFRSGLPRAVPQPPRVAFLTPEPQAYPPGSLSLRLDPRGRLVRLVAAPDPAAAPAESPPDEAVKAAFRLAGLPASRFQPVEPRVLPPVHGDVRLAFRGTAPEAPALPLEVDAVTWRGRLVFFDVSGPWRRLDGATPRGAASGLAHARVFLNLIVLCAGLAFAARNLASGRGDTGGAFRVASFVLACDFVTGLLRTAPSLDGAGLRLVAPLLAWALFSAATIWVYYVALEPHVRHLLPECLVSWTRLLAGRLRDPMVARDVLLGLVSFHAVTGGALLLMKLPGVPSEPFRTSLSALSGTRFFLASLVEAPREGIDLALFYLLVVLGVRSLVRGRRAGTWACFAVLCPVWATSLGFLTGGFGLPQALVAIFWAAVWTVLLTRFGLLSLVVLGTVANLGVLPLTFDFSAWSAGVTAWTAALLFALAVWATRVARS